MKTMTNDECKDKVEQHISASKKDEIKLFHICAFGRYGADDSNGLEDDTCQVYFLKMSYIVWLMLSWL